MEMRKKMEMKKKMKRRKISNPRLLPFFGYCRCIFLMQPFIFFSCISDLEFLQFSFFERTEPFYLLIFIFGFAML